MEFLREKQNTVFYRFLAALCVLWLLCAGLASALILGEVRQSLRERDAVLVSGLLAQGVEEKTVAAALGGKASAQGWDFLERTGRGETDSPAAFPGMKRLERLVPELFCGGVLLFSLCLLVGSAIALTRREAAYHGAQEVVEAFLQGDFEKHLPSGETGGYYSLLSAVEELARALRSSNEEERRSKLFLRDMISDISHQLKTPLAALSLYLDIMETESAFGGKSAARERADAMLRGKADAMLRERADAMLRGKADAVPRGKENAVPQEIVDAVAQGMEDVVPQGMTGAAAQEALAAVSSFAGRARQSVDRMESLIRTLLKMARLDVGGVVFEQSRVQAGDLAERAVQQLRARAGREGKQIRLEGDPRVLVCCDPVWTAEALENLVKNALDHTGEGGRIRIGWQTSPGCLRLSVSDDGCGIAPEDMYHIFKRFYRGGDPGQGAEEGLGLGLPLAKAIVEGQGGVLSVESTPGRGSVFSVVFPEAFLTKP